MDVYSPFAVADQNFIFLNKNTDFLSEFSEYKYYLCRI